MSTVKINLAAFQRKNLIQLTKWVWKNRMKIADHFEMSSYFAYGLSEQVDKDNVKVCAKHECGTSACFAGHGPMAGISPKKNEKWGNYIGRVFTGRSTLNGKETDDNEDLIYYWVFHPTWSNNIEEACRRACWLLDGNPIPKGGVYNHGYDITSEIKDIGDWEEMGYRNYKINSKKINEY